MYVSSNVSLYGSVTFYPNSNAVSEKDITHDFAFQK